MRRLDFPNAKTGLLFWGGVDRSSSYLNVVAVQHKMANYIEKGRQKESIKTEKGRGDFELQENIQYYSKGRSLNEANQRQAGQNYVVVATTGSSIFVVAVVLLFCARRTDDQEQTEIDESVRLTESPTGKMENGEPKDLEKGASSFEHDNTNKVVNDGEEGRNGCAGATSPACMNLPPPPPPPGPPPPPPPKPRGMPAPPLRGGRAPPPPPKAANHRTHSSSLGGEGNEYDNQRTRLKPFFWDKVLASPEHSMVWDEIKAGSFQFNEEMIESLFGYNPEEKKSSDRRGRQANTQTTFIQIIDSRKAQNLSILLKALNVTTQEVHDALLEGHELPAELLQTLIRMAPTSEEELKLRLYSGDMSQIGTAERFLKSLVEIPFAFRRMECLLFIMTIKEEASGLKESFSTLEVASNKLRNSRLFLKILEAVLKTGNRMNDGTYRGGAQAFKLDTLLKLADVKGTDGKTTLLHFVIQEIIRTEGMKAAQAAKELYISNNSSNVNALEYSTANVRALGLQIVSNVSTELHVIKKAAIIDSDALTSTAAKLGQSLLKTKDFLNREMQNLGEESRFYLALKEFVQESEGEITWLLQEERRVIELVKKTVDYFHGNSTKDEGLRLFVVVRDFLTLLDRICVEIQKKMEEEAKTASKASPQDLSSSIRGVIDKRHKLLPSTEFAGSDCVSKAEENPTKEVENDAESTCSDKDKPVKDDNKVISVLMRTYSFVKEKSKRDDSEFSSILRTYSVKERPAKEAQTSSIREKPLPKDDDEEVVSSILSETASTSYKEYSYPQSCAKQDLTELPWNEQQKEILTQEKVIEDMRKKLFPVIQGSRHDESSSSSSDDDDGDDDKSSQISSKRNLTNVSSQESKGFSEESRIQASDDNKEINQVSSQEKAIDDIQHRLFKMIQDRRDSM
ncbi:hypothetical protein V2J09_009070 [Rumex salicifolius]